MKNSIKYLGINAKRLEWDLYKWNNNKILRNIKQLNLIKWTYRLYSLMGLFNVFQYVSYFTTYCDLRASTGFGGGGVNWTKLF